MSGSFLARLPGRLRLDRERIAALWAAVMPAAGRLRTRLAAFDLVSALIRAADAVEAGGSALLGAVRRLRASRSLGFSAALVWRGLAALAGIGLATSLVSALSATGEGEATLASLAVASATEARPTRDVRVAPQHPAPAGEWLAIARPIVIFGLEAPELDRQAPAYDAMRSADGARRRDTLGFGAFAEDKPHLLLRLTTGRNGDEDRAALSQPFLIGLVRDAAARGMSVQRSGVPAAIQTRFGAVETADVALSDGSVSRACVAFRQEAGDGPLALAGWWCGQAGRPADRRQLTCLIDRIDLLAAGDDKALRAAFARSELNRQPGCAPARLAAAGRKASWLDADAPAPTLKSAARR